MNGNVNGITKTLMEFNANLLGILTCDIQHYGINCMDGIKNISFTGPVEEHSR